MPTPAEQLAALAANRYGQPIPLAPDGRAWDAVVSQLATAAQREAVLTVYTSDEGQAGSDFPLEVAAYGPNLTICEINSVCSSWEIAFNEPRNWQKIRPSQSWVGQIFSRVFIRATGASPVAPSVGDTIIISYGSAFLLSPSLKLFQPRISTQTSSGHYGNGLILNANPNRLKVEISGIPVQSGVTGVDCVGFGNTDSVALDNALFLRSFMALYGAPSFDFPIASATDNSQTNRDFLGFDCMFWDGNSGPIQVSASSPQNYPASKTFVTIEGGEAVYMEAIDWSTTTRAPFSLTPGFLKIKEFIQY